MLNQIRHLILPKIRQMQRNNFDNFKISYSQSGEDLILQILFSVLKISKISYLDVGAHHPSYLSNTYLFYKNGGSGVCVEPDPSLFAEFGKKRPRDINLNCGVGVVPGEDNFYVMSTSTLNTFSKDDAERCQAEGKHRIIKTMKLKLENINEIIQRHFEKTPNFVSLDVEGLDYSILKNFDFKKYRPEVFCLETLSYTTDNTERKLTEIIDLMLSNGYIIYSDTYINTIFVEKEAWARRK
jgi:FkbM family methyltransferase